MQRDALPRTQSPGRYDEVLNTAGLDIVDKIANVETFCVELPYRGQVNFRAVSESKGQYVILRLTTNDGAKGISESVARLRQNGEDARALAYDIDTFFAPLLEGADPLAHNHILEEIGRIKGNSRFARSGPEPGAG